MRLVALVFLLTFASACNLLSESDPVAEGDNITVENATGIILAPIAIPESLIPYVDPLQALSEAEYQQRRILPHRSRQLPMNTDESGQSDYVVLLYSRELALPVDIELRGWAPIVTDERIRVERLRWNRYRITMENE